MVKLAAKVQVNHFREPNCHQRNDTIGLEIIEFWLSVSQFYRIFLRGELNWQFVVRSGGRLPVGGFTVTRLGIQRNGNVSHTSDRRFRNLVWSLKVYCWVNYIANHSSCFANDLVGDCWRRSYIKREKRSWQSHGKAALGLTLKF